MEKAAKACPLPKFKKHHKNQKLIWLKLGTNVRYHKVIYKTKYQFKKTKFPRRYGAPLEKLQFSLFYA